ncbi:hypothetical protein LCGC14_0876550 [marine sediment metagenome]|uniref:Uncharacterized protein n=1 Tax=marine sediment metagenome TaxID=412755 RepID=A0A0F9SA42_9ZZZZ|nr:hypothetical protein [bacterium]
MTIQLNESNGRSKYALTIIFTVGFLVVCILGVLFNGTVFSYVFVPLAIIQTAIVSSLFERNKQNGS